MHNFTDVSSCHLACLLGLLSIIWQYVSGTLQQVISEEEAPEWVLDTTAHLN